MGRDGVGAIARGSPALSSPAFFAEFGKLAWRYALHRVAVARCDVDVVDPAVEHQLDGEIGLVLVDTPMANATKVTTAFSCPVRPRFAFALLPPLVRYGIRCPPISIGLMKL